VEKIQHSYRAYRWNSRNAKFLKATLHLQRVWQGALTRQWIRRLHESAIDIQRYARGLLVRVSLDRFGRELLRKSQADLTQLMKRRGELGEDEYLAQASAIAEKAKISLSKHRDRNVDLRRNGASTLKSKQARILDKRKKIKMKGSLQPVRISIFETFPAVARRAQQTAQNARFGCIHSGVLTEARKCHRRLNRTMPHDDYAKDPKMRTAMHAAAKRGHAAMFVQRNTKNCEVTASKRCLLADDEFENWMKQQFQVA